MADLNADGGQQIVHMITENGGKAISVRTDVSQAVEVQALIAQAVETYGRLDCAQCARNHLFLEDICTVSSLPSSMGRASMSS